VPKCKPSERCRRVIGTRDEAALYILHTKSVFWLDSDSLRGT